MATKGWFIKIGRYIFGKFPTTNLAHAPNLYVQFRVITHKFILGCLVFSVWVGLPYLNYHIPSKVPSNKPPLISAPFGWLRIISHGLLMNEYCILEGMGPIFVFRIWWNWDRMGWGGNFPKFPKFSFVRWEFRLGFWNFLKPDWLRWDLSENSQDFFRFF